MKRILAILLLLCTTVLYTHAQSRQLMLDVIASTTAQTRDMECDFVQTKKIKLLNRSMVSRGHMSYRQPDKLRWEYTTPYTYVFVVNGSKVQILNNNRKDVIDVDRNRMFREIVNIMLGTVAGTSLGDRSSFRTTVTGTQTVYIATLVPQKKEMRQMYSNIILHFDPKAGVVSKIEMNEAKGDITTIELRNIHKNRNLNDARFSVK
ncbi:MAG: outer membrane lipoprotein carrier protein LolA [Bacteroidaceae bacterium]|nr:outer membrane lipoprotein carrier protein LolA [Bacteroidaceae bacterium]